MRSVDYHGNKERSGVNFNATVKLADPKNPIFGAKMSTVSYTSRVIADFVFKYHQLVTVATRVGWSKFQ